jgi:hypothetical protein
VNSQPGPPLWEGLAPAPAALPLITLYGRSGNQDHQTQRHEWKMLEVHDAPLNRVWDAQPGQESIPNGNSGVRRSLADPTAHKLAFAQEVNQICTKIVEARSISTYNATINNHFKDVRNKQAVFVPKCLVRKEAICQSGKCTVKKQVHPCVDDHRAL